MQLADAVAWWMPHARDELSRGHFAQVDVDNLIEPVPQLPIRALITCMNLAVQDILRSELAIIGMTVIPLNYEKTNRIPTDYPKLADLLDRPWTYGPGRVVPGLYLIRPSLLAQTNSFDEYRRTIPSGALADERLTAYYRAWRTPQFDEEWNREICIRTHVAAQNDWTPSS